MNDFVNVTNHTRKTEPSPPLTKQRGHEMTLADNRDTVPLMCICKVSMTGNTAKKKAGSKFFPWPGILYIWCRCNIKMKFFFYQILHEMSHHNILQLHHAYPAFDRYYLVMELACGGELFEDLVSRNAFSESTAREVMLQLFSGVQYIHSLRIVHRVRKVAYIVGLDGYKILANCPTTPPPS